jgi:hypothetical protein
METSLIQFLTIQFRGTLRCKVDTYITHLTSEILEKTLRSVGYDVAAIIVEPCMGLRLQSYLSRDSWN